MNDPTETTLFPYTNENPFRKEHPKSDLFKSLHIGRMFLENGAVDPHQPQTTHQAIYRALPVCGSD